MRKELIVLLCMAGVLAMLPLAFGGDMITMQLLILCMIYAVVAQGWDLVMGYAGVFSFGQITFMAIGSYVSAVLAMPLDISPWLAMPIAACAAAVVGVVIGLVCMRLTGDYIALMTFAFQLLLVPLLVSDWGRSIGTGGTQGLVGIPPLSIGGYRFMPLELTPWFYVGLVLFFASLYVIYRAIFSPWGTAFVALRDNQRFAKSLGVNEFKYRLLVFALSALLTGLAGAFYAHFTGVVSVRLLTGLDLFLILMIMQVVGGMGRFPGAAIGAFIITFLNEWLRPFESYRPMVFGAAIILLIIFFPQGILGAVWGRDKTASGRRDPGAPIRRWLSRLRRAGGGEAGEGVEP